jgi:trimeric autotransporter adhesin
MGKSRSASSPPRNVLSPLLHTLAAFALALLLPLAGCGDDDDGPPELSVSPAAVTLAKGGTSTVSAKVDGRPASSAVSWRSSDPNVATVVEGDGGTAQITAVNAGEARITVSLEKSSAEVVVTVGEAVVESIAITPPAPTVAAGTATDLTATATLSDKTTRNVTAQVQWSTSDGAKATVSPAGRLTGVTKGAATITARLGTLNATAAVTITDAVLQSISVTPVNVSLPRGRTRQMTATGTFSDSSTQDLTAMATWASSVPSTATVSAAGVVTGAAVGNAMISATLNGVTGQVAVSITAAVLQSIAVTPAAPSLAKGLTLSLTATGTYSDATTQDLSAIAAWTSSNVAAATTSGRVVTAVAPGNATISATLGGITGTTALTVTAAAIASIEVTPATVSLAAGRTQQLTATAIFTDNTNQDITATALWASSDVTHVSVSNAAGSQGLATAIAAGSANVTATKDGITGTSAFTVTTAVLQTIDVTPASFSLAVGRTQQLTAMGQYSDGSTADITAQASWSSSATGIASVSDSAGTRGLVTAVGAGTADLTAALDGITGVSRATVTDATLVSIAVTPATGSLPVGRTRQFTATGTFSDTTTADITAQVTWSSSDAAAVSISNAAGSQGLATALAPGDVTLTATLTGVTGTATLTAVAVTLQSIAVTPAGPTLPAGRTRQLTATGSYSDGSTADLTTQVTWASSDVATATVSNVDGSRGLVTAVAPGTTTVSAMLGSITGTTTVTVRAAVIDSIAVTPATASLDVGATQQFTATATLSNGTTLDVTGTASWTSSSTAVATISATGLATAVAGGTATITADQGGVSGTASLTVRQLVSIAITPAGDLARGTSRQLTATATFNDNTTVDVTATATWTSSNAAALTVGDAAATKGLATAVTTAGATVTATVGAVSGSQAIGGCSLVINEVQVGGAGTGNAANEWIEIASKCTSVQNLTGLRLVYRSAAGTSDVTPILLDLTGTIPAGGYNFYVHTFFASTYPTATAVYGSGNTGSLSGTGGGVGLRIGAAGALLDSMGYGTATNAFVEGIVFGAIAGSTSAARIPDKTDTNNNSVDFQSDATPTPGAANAL